MAGQSVQASFDAPPVSIDLAIPQATTFGVTFTWLVDGQQRELDGCRAVMSVAQRAGRPALFTVTSTDGEITLEDGGRIVVLVPAAKTALLPARRRARYDLVVIDGDEVIRVADGEVRVLPAVTQVS